jgi:hypothetical protein
LRDYNISFWDVAEVLLKGVEEFNRPPALGSVLYKNVRDKIVN